MKASRFTFALAFLAATLQAQTLTVSLRHDSVPGGGETGASGFATLEFIGTSLNFTLLINGVTNPTGAAIHRGYPGQTGAVEVNLSPAFSGNLATGTVNNVPETKVAALLANPAGYYLQVTSQGKPNGAIRGQLKGETLGGATVLYAPVLAKVAGQVGTNFVSDLALANLGESDVNVTVRYFPAAGGSPQTAQVQVPARGQKTVNDALATLFNASGRGAAVFESPAPIAGQLRVFNDQRGNPSFPLPGTFNQFFRLTSLEEASTGGLLLGLANRPAGSGQGFRTNVGYFNPHDAPVTLHLAAYTATNDLLASRTVPLPAKANDLRSVTDLFGDSLATQNDFFIRFSVSGGSAFVFASMVDNVTGDAVTILPQR
ncbi:MAG: CHRD domain-containing protein [Thermoanaerobaculum sp.]|nr:CHRD domain-containing protein [Thermoanaerobaculum sp.]